MNLDSDELQVYASVAVILLIWAALSFGAWSSFRGSRRPPDTRRLARIILGVLPILLGLLFFMAEIRRSGEDDWFTFDLSWLFLLPVSLGVIALVAWFRVRRRSHHAA